MTKNQSLYLLSTFVTQMGNGCTYIIGGKLSLDIFGLASVFGAILVIEQLQRIFLSSIGGLLTDRYLPTKVIFHSDLISCILIVIFIGLSLIGYMTLSIVILLILINLIKSLRSPAIYALVRHISKDEELLRINNLTNLVLQSGFLFGLILMAILIQNLPILLLLAIDAFTYLIAGLLILKISTLKLEASLTFPMSKQKRIFNFKWRRVLDLIKNYPVLFIAAIVSGLQINIILMYNTALFKFIKEVYPNQSNYLPILEVFFTISVITFSYKFANSDLAKRTKKWMWLVFAIQGGVLSTFIFTQNLRLLCLAAFLFGICLVIIIPIAVSEMHKFTPTALAGRIGALKNIIAGVLAIPLLTLLSYFLDAISLDASYALIVIVSVVPGSYSAYRLYHISKTTISLEDNAKI